MNKNQLRELIEQSLKRQGYRIRNGNILPPKNLTKERLRKLHSVSVKHKIQSAYESLYRYEDKLLDRIAKGNDVNPYKITPQLIEVVSGSEDERLFRYATLHWSIPVSTGYGRRLRFLVKDEQNGKLIGIIGLGDPVFALGARDNWIGWDRLTLGENLRYVMDAFALGAVPPYSHLLCGKLVAMLAVSNDVKDAFRRKYQNNQSLIQQKESDARLALITTTSALGRSSIYNRLRLDNRLLYQRVGFTRGSGEFHFSNGLYGAISEYATRYCIPTAKQESWGTGFRNRREVVRKCLSKVGLSSKWMYHGVEREVFVVPLAINTREFLRGEHTRLRWFNTSTDELVTFFKNRWLMPKAERDDTYKQWDPEQWRLWPKKT
jgi:hypothetical protein